MRKQIYLVILMLVALSCTNFMNENPYQASMNKLVLSLVLPEGFDTLSTSGFDLMIEEMNTGSRYTMKTDSTGQVIVDLPTGLYRVTANGKVFTDVFNGMADKLAIVNGEFRLNLPLVHSTAGAIIIKELYNGGCKKSPIEGDYQSDKYMILHNNDYRVQYLDSLCVGTLSPYNSNGANNFVSKDPVTGESVFPDFVPIVQAIWQFPGDGDDFPLQPGEDAVLCFCGAIDHTVQYPLSVNLNKENYFVCYNLTHFPNTLYHPVPGDKISQDRILNLVIKTGKATAYTLSLNSPAVLVWKPKGISMLEYAQNPDNQTPVPGGSENVVKIPYEWAYDAVEVFNGQATNNTKRLAPVLDASYVLQTDVYLGRSVMRRVDEQASQKAGYEVLMDSNNSLKDFYETEKQSLHE